MLGLSRHGCPGPTSLVPGFLWGNSPLTLRLPPCPRLTPRYGQYLTHAPSHITREVAILVPRARRFLVKLSRVALETRKGSGGHGGRAVSPSLRLISNGPLNTALILQGSEGYAILMSLNEMRKSCPWLPLLS